MRRILVLAAGVGIISGAVVGYGISSLTGSNGEPADAAPLVLSTDDHAGGNGELEPVQEALSFSSSRLAQLGEAQDALVSGGGSLTRGRLTGETSGTAKLVVNTVIWSTSNVQLTPGDLVTLSVEAGPRDIATLSGLGEHDALALVTADGRLVSSAMVEGDDLVGPSSDDLFFLADAASLLASSGFVPSEASICNGAPQPSEGRTEVQAIADYFTVLGEDSLADRQVASQQTRMLAEELALEVPPMVDPVTGLAVHASLNDIIWQLESGIDVNAVETLPEIPLLVTVPEVPDTLTAIVVFFDSDTGRRLGWIDTIPEGWREGATADEVIPTRKVFLEPPRERHRLAVALRDLTQRDWDCPLRPNEPILMEVPFDDFAGDSRARLIIQEGRYVEATRADFDRVHQGIFDTGAASSTDS